MATKEQVFAELADRFKLEDKVRDQILATGVATLSEFRFFAQDDTELLAAFYSPVEDKPLQKARLRQAWAAVCQAEKAREDRGFHLMLSLDGGGVALQSVGQLARCLLQPLQVTVGSPRPRGRLSSVALTW